jgi:hypothetical protein
MRPEIILETVETIPITDPGMEVSGSEVWETDDGQAHIRVARYETRLRGDAVPIDEIDLTISGSPEDRNRIKIDFIRAFKKEPDRHNRTFLRSGPQDRFLWRLERKK